MKTITTFAMLAFLSGCASGPAEPDPFTSIAEEWQGAYINEMIEIWGNPRQLQEDDGGGGVARWAHHRGSDNRPMSCDVTAAFDPSGMILSIDVISRNCNLRTNRNIPQLKRP